MVTETRKPRSGAMDAVLGQRVRELRRALGLSQTALGERVGLTFQQVQKYENGSNRISALMLVKLAGALDVTSTELLRDIDPEVSDVVPSDSTAQLLADFSRIQSAELRDSVLRIVAGLARR